jgi:hypothetical protein
MNGFKNLDLSGDRARSKFIGALIPGEWNHEGCKGHFFI